MKQLIPKPGFKTFGDVQIGEVFRGLRPERIKNRETGETRSVPTNGLYVKVGNTVGVDIAHNNKDTILSLKTPVRVLDRRVDCSHLEAYRVAHRGAV